ncbi:MAG: hypothetical protein ABFC34_15330, partial [Methanobacterium sp.]
MSWNFSSGSLEPSSFPGSVSSAHQRARQEILLRLFITLLLSDENYIENFEKDKYFEKQLFNGELNDESNQDLKGFSN